MTFTQEIATKLASEGMSRDEMIQFIYSVTTYTCLSEIHETVDTAIADA